MLGIAVARRNSQSFSVKMWFRGLHGLVMVLSTAVANDTKQMPSVIVVATHVVGYWDSSSFDSLSAAETDARGGICVNPLLVSMAAAADGDSTAVSCRSANVTSVMWSEEWVKEDRNAAKS